MDHLVDEPEEQYLPLSLLNDLLFCERRCALHRIEQVWMENIHTLEGSHRHRRVHDVHDEELPEGRCVRGLWVYSRRLRLIGKADVVVFRPPPPSPGNDGGSPNAAKEVPYPIEYKLGRKRRWSNDDVQVCAQALCLEEMLQVEVPAGAIFHMKSKRRRELLFTAELRAKTEEAARRLHELVAAGVTPPPVLKSRCRGCSLHDLCMPQLLSQKHNLDQYQRRLWET